MKITDKQKCIAEQCIYGTLKGYYSGSIIDCPFDGFRNSLNGFIIYPVHELFNSSLGIDKVILPILFPMSWLDKKISIKNYNNNKSFIPLLEIMKVTIFNREFKSDKKGVFYNLDSNNKIYCKWIQNGTIGLFDDKGYISAINLSIKALDLLYQWHFDTRMLIEKQEAKSIEDITNVYK